MSVMEDALRKIRDIVYDKEINPKAAGVQQIREALEEAGFGPEA